MVKPAIELPSPSDERIAVHITPAALREVRRGHPWIWDGSITRVSQPGRPGDLAVVFDDKRKFAAIGLWDPDAPIAVRILHRGAPRTIDDEFFADRLLDSYAARQPLHDDPSTTAYRLVHGENDGLPGLVVDRYEDSLVVKLDSAAWVPHLGRLVDPLIELSDANRVVVRSSRRIVDQLPAALRDRPTVVGSTPPGPVEFREHGLLFEADIERGQKTGHFLDQRDNRALVATRCRDATVLDVFCNTGGFSVHAAAGGARAVHSVDSSAHAIEATRRHVERNRNERGFSARHSAVADDAFAAMESMVRRNERFDVVIVDPPSFAPNEAAVPTATRAYRRLTSLAIELLTPGGTLFQASCSSRIDTGEFHRIVSDEIAHHGRIAADPIRTGHALDHPIGFAQGAYLKAMMADIHTAAS